MWYPSSAHPKDRRSGMSSWSNRSSSSNPFTKLLTNPHSPERQSWNFKFPNGQAMCYPSSPPLQNIPQPTDRRGILSRLLNPRSCGLEILAYFVQHIQSFMVVSCSDWLGYDIIRARIDYILRARSRAKVFRFSSRENVYYNAEDV